MFEGLIDFIEQSVFTLVNQILEREGSTGAQQAGRILSLLVQFAERNPGMTRVMVGDALVYENERLQQRMNQFFDKIEATLRQVLRGAAAAGRLGHAHGRCAGARPRSRPSWSGSCSAFARSGFRRAPSEHLEATIALIV